MKIKVCRECGVPLKVSRGQVWHDNGVITEKRRPDMRMILYESEHLDYLFHVIEEIIGVPLEHIVVESKRRDVKEYTEGMIPKPLRRVVRYVGFKPIAGMLSRLGIAYGFGDIKLVESRRRFTEDDYLVMTVRNPHSLLFFLGENLGAWEAIDGRDSVIEYQEIGERTYRCTVRIGEHPVELQERLERKRYPLKPGDIHFERCPRCRIPQDISAYRWNLEDGVIIDPQRNMRISLFSPAGFEAVLDDLEAELGEAIPEAVIEAQRRNVREHLQEAVYMRKEYLDFKRMLALNGLGNLSRFEPSEKGLEVTIENSCIHLLMVGMVQGIFEMARGVEKSSYEWELAPDGDLNISIRI